MRFQRRGVARWLLIFAIAIFSSYCAGQAPSHPSAKPVAAFPPLEQWKTAVTSGNVATLQATLQQQSSGSGRHGHRRIYGYLGGHLLDRS